MLLDCSGIYRGCRPRAQGAWNDAELKELVELVSKQGHGW
jgi:hypothetical protein